MVYKKYIKRGGKLYGPYKYHSRKVNGKVITEYLGKADKKSKSKKKKRLILLTIGLITIFFIFILSYNIGSNNLNNPISNIISSSSDFVKTITSLIVSENLENESVVHIKTTGDMAWIVFYLSIIKAEHLDSNRNFISDIYEEVKVLDDVWSETISLGHYVRVTFEENLTSENDITIYPRIIDGTPKIEVYEVDDTKLIAEFTNIISNQYNKVLLTNLQGVRDTFDLRVVGGSLEIDHIVDPSASSSMEVEK